MGNRGSPDPPQAALCEETSLMRYGGERIAVRMERPFVEDFGSPSILLPGALIVVLAL